MVNDAVKILDALLLVNPSFTINPKHLNQNFYRSLRFARHIRSAVFVHRKTRFL